MEQLFIAVVEDDLDDQEFICSALKEIKKDISISKFINGADFLEFLQTTNDYPDMVITDIRMPLVDGWEVIDSIKGNESTTNIPVVVLSTSRNEQDREKAAHKGAVAYYVKPSSTQEYIHITNTILQSFNR